MRLIHIANAPRYLYSQRHIRNYSEGFSYIRRNALFIKYAFPRSYRTMEICWQEHPWSSSVEIASYWEHSALPMFAKTYSGLIRRLPVSAGQAGMPSLLTKKAGSHRLLDSLKGIYFAVFFFFTRRVAIKITTTRKPTTSTIFW